MINPLSPRANRGLFPGVVTFFLELKIILDLRDPERLFSGSGFAQGLAFWVESSIELEPH